jgi:glutathionyl-hydroquinone reductase
MTQPENILINSSTSFLDKLRVELLWDHESLMIIINEIAKVRSVLNTPSFTDTELTSTLSIITVLFPLCKRLDYA